VTVEFEEATHTYRIDGRQVPSVTQCLSLLDPFQKVDRAVLEAARQFGHHGHKAMALLVRDALDWNTLDPALVPYIEGGAKFLSDFSDRVVVASELIVANVVLGVAGTMDLLMEDESHSQEVVEFKFTSGVPNEVGPQTAAYAFMLKHERPNMARGPSHRIRRRCVVLQPGGYKTVLLTDPADWPDFLSCLNVTKRRIKYGIE
jgi:hypothetical protein